MDEGLKKLVRLVRGADPTLTFTILDIGADPLDVSPEWFYELPQEFPGSRIIAFEVDEALCEKLNRDARAGVTYYARALGRRDETRTFYQTEYSMCSSLYEPNEKLMRLYNGFEFAYLKTVSTIRTYGLDGLAEEHAIGPVDFIKIDIQGAELDVFQGATATLRNVLATVCEVEFIPHYINQPLFGDVSAFLTGQGLMFQRFLEIAGRPLRPVTVNNNPYFPSRHVWTDAVFVKDIFSIPDLPNTALLKLSVLALQYGSPDLAHYCLMSFDARNGSSLAPVFLAGGRPQ